jgi:hypothetical protein
MCIGCHIYTVWGATIRVMEPVARSVSWEAPEHTHPDKGGDWYFALGILTLAVVVAAIVLDNFLFALLAGLSGVSIAVAVSQSPRIIQYGVSVRGIRIDNTVMPFGTLRSFFINEDDPRGPQLLLLSQKSLAPMIVLPIPADYVDEIEEILAPRLPEEFLEESMLNKILEILGF